MQKKPIGSTGLSVTSVCFGASGLGDMPETYGYSVSEERARETVRAVFDSSVNLLDTSNNYGFGRSEERIGQVIRERGGIPDGFVLSTKLDRDMETRCFDAARARRSFEESTKRLGLERIPLLHLHDPEHARDLTEITKDGGSLDELFKLKEEGLVDAVGLAMGRVDIMFPILKAYPFDALISHNRMTILNRSAAEMFEYADAQGIAILNAAPFAGGVLAKGSAITQKVTYQDVDQAALEPVRRIEALCAAYGVPQGAVALQFSTRMPIVASTMLGVSKPERVQQTLDWANTEIPQELWDALADLPFETDDPEANRVYNPG